MRYIKNWWSRNEKKKVLKQVLKKIKIQKMKMCEM